MNPTVKAKWVAALRSGEYQQGQTALRTHQNEFCCLGVLCDLYAKEHTEAMWCLPTDADGDAMHDADQTFSPAAMSVADSVYLPPDVQKWAGLDSGNPVVRFEEADRPLADINDSGEPFENIATLIDKEL